MKHMMKDRGDASCWVVQVKTREGWMMENEIYKQGQVPATWRTRREARLRAKTVTEYSGLKTRVRYCYVTWTLCGA